MYLIWEYGCWRHYWKSARRQAPICFVMGECQWQAQVRRAPAQYSALPDVYGQLHLIPKAQRKKLKSWPGLAKLWRMVLKE
jgi:hypothetical protein